MWYKFCVQDMTKNKMKILMSDTNPKNMLIHDAPGWAEDIEKAKDLFISEQESKIRDINSMIRLSANWDCAGFWKNVPSKVYRVSFGTLETLFVSFHLKEGNEEWTRYSFSPEMNDDHPRYSFNPNEFTLEEALKKLRASETVDGAVAAHIAWLNEEYLKK